MPERKSLLGHLLVIQGDTLVSNKKTMPDVYDLCNDDAARINPPAALIFLKLFKFVTNI